MIRPIAIGLSPNVEKIDFSIALSNLFQFYRYTNGNETKLLEEWFEKFYKEKAFAFSSGRGALFAILTNLGIKKGDEVLVTGFTCVAVVDAILATGVRPIYVDITKSLILDENDLEKKYTKKAKVLIVQHAFGIDNTTDKIIAFAKNNNLFLIEDVAHGIGIVSNKKLLGTKGIAAIFSFGRDKAFSCVSGGMVITKDKKLANRLTIFQKQQPNSSPLWIFQNLFHMVSFYILILPLYNFSFVGKLVLVILQKIGLLALPIDANELNHFSLYYRQFPQALARVALSQLSRMEKFNKAREEFVSTYKKTLPKKIQLSFQGGSLLRFPIIVANPQAIKAHARDNNIYVGDWYSNVIDPKGIMKKNVFYKKNSCPTAQYLANHILNLPTYPTLSKKDIEKVVTIITQYATY